MSYTKHIYHIVFSTKEWRPLIDDALRPQLCEYLGGIVRQLGGISLRVNGPTDHIHIVAVVPATIAIADFVRDVKSGSTNWIHRTMPDRQSFRWQDGYASFTVSHSAIAQVVAYVAGQVENHKTMSFRDELLLLLEKHQVDFDDRYLMG